MEEELGIKTGEFYKLFVETDVNDKGQLHKLELAKDGFLKWVKDNFPDSWFIQESIERDFSIKFETEYRLIFPKEIN
jgi:hypothetical protein